jgi:hypothetical protein
MWKGSKKLNLDDLLCVIYCSYLIQYFFVSFYSTKGHYGQMTTVVQVITFQFRPLLLGCLFFQMWDYLYMLALISVVKWYRNNIIILTVLTEKALKTLSFWKRVTILLSDLCCCSWSYDFCLLLILNYL